MIKSNYSQDKWWMSSSPLITPRGRPLLAHTHHPHLNLDPPFQYGLSKQKFKAAWGLQRRKRSTGGTHYRASRQGKYHSFQWNSFPGTVSPHIYYKTISFPCPITCHPISPPSPQAHRLWISSHSWHSYQKKYNTLFRLLPTAARTRGGAGVTFQSCL